jgi:chemotaxis protein CheC
MRPESLTEIQHDALREVGSIGAGHAATALSQLVDHRIELGVPQLEVLAVTDIPSVFGGPEQLVAAVYDRVLGDIGGSMVFLANRESALALVDLMRNRTIGTTKSLGANEEALVGNAASILVAAYLASVGRLADLSILPGRGAFAFDMVGAILDAVAAEIGLVADEAIVIKTEFESDDAEPGEVTVDAYLLFLPDEAGLQALLERLGLA